MQLKADRVGFEQLARSGGIEGEPLVAVDAPPDLPFRIASRSIVDVEADLRRRALTDHLAVCQSPVCVQQPRGNRRVCACMTTAEHPFFEMLVRELTGPLDDAFVSLDDCRFELGE